jgi:diguanylate cyclase (GGDEF)-like protein
MSYELQRGERYSKLILNAQKNIIILTNGEEIIDANQSFLDFFNYKSIHDFKSEHQCICDYFEENNQENFIQKRLYKNVKWSHYVLKHPDENLKTMIIVDNKKYIFSLNGAHTIINNEEISIIVLTDITPLMQENANLYKLSHTDKLTQIHNRHSFDIILREMYTQAEKDKLVFSIIFFDIDHFKIVNDTYGHAVGDNVLKAITSLMSSKIRSNDVFARWGGEEFIIILPGIEQEVAFKIAQKLRIFIENEEMKIVGNITCSFGVSDTQYSKSITSLIKDADLALYKAKEEGRNRVVMAKKT